MIEAIGIETDAPKGGLCVAYFDGEFPTLSMTMKKNTFVA